ncbi:MAG: hydroxylase [Pseudomonadota bacterium]
MKIQYLEVVATNAEAVCAAYEKALGVQFSEPDQLLGGARTTAMADGSMLGVRAPMHESEQPTIRPYWLTDNIEAALEAATGGGAEVAHPPLEIPGKGTFAIYIQGDVHHGLWQL